MRNEQRSPVETAMSECPEPRQVLFLPIASINPSPENDLLYRPAHPGDPEVVALAESIAVHGIKEPLTITADNYILSGHRRLVAARMSGLTHVPCRRENIVREGNPEFVRLLPEYNRQRVKTVDEVVREETVLASPEEAHRRIVEHRKSASRFAADVIDLCEVKQRHSFSNMKQPFVAAAIAAVNNLREFWPVTIRQVHYALLNNPPMRNTRRKDSCYVNDQQSYKDLSDVLTRARLRGMVSPDAIDDETRPVTTWNCHQSPAGFIRGQLDRFLKGYYRDLQQSQPNHIEIVGEKKTLGTIIHPIALDYCLPVTLGGGYTSLPPREKMLERYRKSGKEELILLMLSDFDPEGEDIAQGFARSMRDDFGVEKVVAIKVALTQIQVEEMRLPTKLVAKKGSSRRAKFVEKHGEAVHELEAVPPIRLQKILRRVIDSVLDVDAFNAEIESEKRDAVKLDAYRRAAHQVLSYSTCST